MDLFASILDTKETINYSFDDDDYGWIQVIKGEVFINDTTLKAGDGASIQGEKEVKIISNQPDTEFLWFHFT